MTQAIVANKLLTLLLFATLADPNRALAGREPVGQLETTDTECASLAASQGQQYGTTDCYRPSTSREPLPTLPRSAVAAPRRS